MIAVGRYDEALALIRERAPLAASLGRICHHPCEEKCRRAAVDQAVSIRALKRFAADNADRAYGARPKAPSTGKAVAVIGGGPAGLTAAADLTLAGHAVTVFERNKAAGGALLTGVPAYRLPKDTLAWDVGYVASLGVEILCDQAVDSVKARSILDEHDAVVLATGLPISRGLPISGADARGVFLALPFLAAANGGDPLPLEGEVIVIGGGNVAMDVARTALRTGASSVSLYCLEGPELDDLPAFSWEIEEAVDEGVSINPSWGPVEVLTDNGEAGGVRFKRCLRVFDDEGRFNPSFDEAKTIDVTAKTVILAIGQAGDVAFMEEIVRVERGRLAIDPETLGTTDPKVFACGEVVTGPGAAIAAIASGHDAAESVDAFLSGRARKKAEEPPVVGELRSEIAKLARMKQRAEAELLPAGVRTGGFMEVEATFPEDTAVREALRCLSCGNGAIAESEACAGCLTCVRVCPFEAPSVERTAAMDPSLCQACGLCAAECPAGAIEIGALDMRVIDRALEGKKTTVFACREAVLLPERGSTADRQVLGIPCAARIDGRAILKAFEKGSGRVLVVGCTNDDCRYGSLAKLTNRIAKVRELLDRIGVGGENLALILENDVDKAVDAFRNMREAAAVEGSTR